jgi:hypothetical protein
MDKPTILLIVLNVVLLSLVFVTRSRKTINKILLVLTSVLMTLSLVEVVYRYFLERESFYAGDFNKHFYEPDIGLGYKMRRAGKFDALKMNSQGDTVFHTYYSVIDDTSNTSASFPHRMGYHSMSHSAELVFFGCSFTFGEGLSDQQSLPYLTGERNELNAVNLGCTGYGIHQVYQLYLNKYLNTDNRQRTFVYSFLYDHILRANGVYEWNQLGPYFVLRGDSVINTGALAAHRKVTSDKLIRYASLFGGLRFLKKILGHLAQKNRLNSLEIADYEATLHLLNRLAKLIAQSGGQLIVLDWDVRNWGNVELNDLPFELIEKRLDHVISSSVKVIRISSITDIHDASNFIPGDGHPSAWMNYKISSYLGDILRQTNNN